MVVDETRRARRANKIHKRTMINISLVSVGGEVLLNWLNKRFIPNVRSQGSIANTFRKGASCRSPAILLSIYAAHIRRYPFISWEFSLNKEKPYRFIIGGLGSNCPLITWERGYRFARPDTSPAHVPTIIPISVARRPIISPASLLLPLSALDTHRPERMTSVRVIPKNIINSHNLPLRSAFSYKRPVSSSHNAFKDDQLSKYTSGRWLWNEREQMNARYRRFNVEGLKKVACEAIGSNGCKSLEKIGEGNYNKAFRLVMQDGRRVIAKIPNPNAGPAQYTTASEVATLDFARTILNLPVPKVLAWSATSHNPVESEYIVMEEASGSQLHTVWQKQELRVKRDIIREIVDIENKMLSVSFQMLVSSVESELQAMLISRNRIGSLYLKNSGYADCVAAKSTATSRELEDKIESRFDIGPLVRREFWAKERNDMRQYHGPCNYFDVLSSCCLTNHSYRGIGEGIP